MAAIVCVSGAPVAPALQLYVVESYGLVKSVLPEPLQPETPDRSGKRTLKTAVSSSEAVAASLNEPAPAGRK